jgi:hypothetical protein
VEYRKKNWTQISRKKAGEYKRNFDPEKARAHRARQKELHGENHHTEYCRRYFLDPKKKAAKVAYDLEYRSQEYGEFSECYKPLELTRPLEVSGSSSSGITGSYRPLCATKKPGG